jgi:hypothetical protein
MLHLHCLHCPQAIATTSKRLEIISTLTSAFRAILAATPGDLLPTVYMCTNRVAPAHAGIELGVGDATLIKVGEWGGCRNCGCDGNDAMSNANRCRSSRVCRCTHQTSLGCVSKRSWLLCVRGVATKTVAPAHAGIELGVGNTILIKVGLQRCVQQHWHVQRI